MTTRINFSDRDWEGLPVNGGTYNFTGNITEDPGWIAIQVGGDNNSSIRKRLEVSGELTSPASLGSTPADRTIFLDVRHTPRGQDYTSFSSLTESHQIIKFKNGETLTEKETSSPVVVDLNTYGRTDGNIYIRIRANDSITFTDADIVVSVLANITSVFTKESPTSETNNLRSISTNTSANTIEEIPSSTAGNVSFKFTQFGYYGDVKQDNKVGMSPTTEIGNDPKYCWKYHEGDGTGNTSVADAIHDGTTIASDVTCAEGDTLTVSRNASGTYTYLKNGVTQATGGSTDTTAQRGDFKLTFQNSRALGIRMDIGAGTITPTFENKVGIEEF